jgi:hypothetical protein
MGFFYEGFRRILLAQFAQDLCERLRVVGSVRAEYICFDYFDVQEIEAVFVDYNAIRSKDRRLHDDGIDCFRTNVSENRADVVRSIESIGLAFLHPTVAHENLLRAALVDPRPNPRHEKRCDQTREETPRTENDLVGFCDRLDRFFTCSRVRGVEIDGLNGCGRLRNGYLTSDEPALHARAESNKLGRRRKDLARSVEPACCRGDCGGEIAVHLSQRCYHQVPNRVARQGPTLKTMLEELAELIVASERDETITNVSRWRDPKLSCQTAG